MQPDRRTSAAAQALLSMSRCACPPLAKMLMAVTAVWRPVSRPEVDASLDQLARGLFAVEPTGHARARALARLVTDEFQPDCGSIDGLWLDTVLANRRGHALVIAAVAAELGRRAGWEVGVCSSPAAWHAGLLHGGVLWLVDPTDSPAGANPLCPSDVQGHCPHELAFVVLAGLAERFADAGDAALADDLREQVALFSTPGRRALLDGLWSDSGVPG